MNAFHLYPYEDRHIKDCLLVVLVNDAFQDGQILRPWLQSFAVLKPGDDTKMLWRSRLVCGEGETAVGRGQYEVFG